MSIRLAPGFEGALGAQQTLRVRKLAMLDAAEVLADLRVPPGNRLEKLVGDRAGQCSTRVNQRWRLPRAFTRVWAE